MKKRLLSIAICVLMFLEVCPTVFALQTSDIQKTDEIIGLFTAMNLIEKADGVELDYSKQVTRAEYIEFWFDLLQMEPSDKLHYYDVPTDHWCFSKISAFTEQKYILGSDNKKFYPDEYITLEQACIIAIRILELDYQNYLGNIPYMSIAKNEDLLDGINGAEAFSLEQMHRLVYNAATKNLKTVSSMSNNLVEYSPSDETILSQYRNIYFKQGTVNAVNGINLYSTSFGDKDYMEIDGERYIYSGGNETDWLGQTVKVYYFSHRKDDGKKTVVYMHNLGKTETLELEITEENAYDSENCTLTYFTEKGKEKKASISQSSKIIYNGEVTDKPLNKVFSGKNYYVKLVEVQEKFDLIIIEKFTTVVVDRIDVTNKVVYDKIDASKLINLDENKYEKISIYTSDGEPATFGDINAGTVMSVAESFSGKSIVIYLSTETQSGKLSKVRDAGGCFYYTVNEKEYMSYTDLSKVSTFGINDEVNLYIDCKGQAVYMDAQRDVNFGYAVGMALDTDHFDKALLINMYDGKSDFTRYTVSDMVNIDGIRCRDAEFAFATLGGADFKPEFVAFRTNSAGEIISLDFAKLEDNSKRTVDDMFIQHAEITTVYLDKYEKKWGLKTRIGTNTIAFGIPTIEENLDNPKKYTKGTGSNLGGGNYKGSSFSYGLEDSEYADIVVVCDLVVGDSELTAHRFLVDEVITELDDEGDVIQRVYGYFGNSYRYFDVEEGYSCEANGIGRGTTIFVDRTLGLVNETTKIVYNPKKPEERPIETNRMNRERDTMVYVNDVVGTSIRGGFETGANFDELFTTYYAQIMLYDSKTDELRKTDLSEVRTYKQYGDKCDSVYTYVHATEFPYNFIIYR